MVNNRIVIQLGRGTMPDHTDYVWFALREPEPDEALTQPLCCSADDPVFVALSKARLTVDSVKAAGVRLFEALMAHPDIEPRLRLALKTDDDSRCPISIDIATRLGAEALPWEAMCSPDGKYLGLDERWALARIVKSRTEMALFYTLTPPIKIAAVLSCLGIPAAGELEALRAAIQQAGPHNVELLVVAGEEQLVVQLRAELAAGTCPEVARVEPMPDDLDGLRRMISEFGPHLLHFFCHGSLEGSPHIAIATTNDWRDGQGISSITAEADEFGGFTRRTDDLPWLIVLNCCEGAGVTRVGNSQSLALSLVLNGTAAAAVGLREPVHRSTANKVTAALYGKFLSDLSARIDKPTDSPQPLDWPRLLVAARDRLASVPGKPRSVTAASRKEWTMPAIYVRPENFMLQVSPRPFVPPRGYRPLGGQELEHTVETHERAARLETTVLKAILTDLPPNQADQVKDDAISRILDLSAHLGVEEPFAGTLR
jgi:hypothetical protein